MKNKYFICIASGDMLFFLNEISASKFEKDTGYTTSDVSERHSIRYCFDVIYDLKRIIKE